jgi:hypothetical protein
MELITDPALITPEWLTEALKTSGLLPVEGRIISAEWKNIGTGKMGDNVRFRLCYDGNYKAPCTLIAKLPAADETARTIAGGMGAYRKEVMFYQELAGVSSIRTPEIYLALIDASGSNFILLMEDLAPAKPGNQLASETIEHAKQALSEASKLHAAFFGKDELLARDYITHTDPDDAAMAQDLLQQSWPGFVERFGHGLSAECIALGEQYVESHSQWVGHYQGQKTLVHGDFRAENILFSESGCTIIIDWQTPMESCCMADVAYFIAGSLDIDSRRAQEHELVEHYRQCLNSKDVTLTQDECWQLYREFSLHGLLITILGAMFSQAGERSDQMFLVMIQRHLQHAVDMSAAEFL